MIDIKKHNQEGDYKITRRYDLDYSSDITGLISEIISLEGNKRRIEIELEKYSLKMDEIRDETMIVIVASGITGALFNAMIISELMEGGNPFIFVPPEEDVSDSYRRSMNIFLSICILAAGPGATAGAIGLGIDARKSIRTYNELNYENRKIADELEERYERLGRYYIEPERYIIE